MCVQVSATISVPMWQMMLVRLGKKTALFIGLPVTNLSSMVKRPDTMILVMYSSG